MFFILKVVLIILLNETYAYITQDSEIILLPARNPTGAKKISLTLKAFGKQIQLNLRRNDKIVSSAFKAWKRNAKGIKEELSQLNTSNFCYYFHDNYVHTAAINFCQGHGLKGTILLENTTLDITPLQNDLSSSSLIGDSCVKTEANVSFGKPHLIKRSLIPNDWEQSDDPMRPSPHIIIELAVFLDKSAYDLLSPLHNRNLTKVRDMLLAYLNGLQVVFHHPSLGVRIDILLTYMKVMETPTKGLNYVGDVNEMLKLFNETLTYYLIQYGTHYHWDITLFLTGSDLYNITKSQDENYILDRTIRGSSVKNTSCNSKPSLAIVEFGLTFNREDKKKIVPGAGFASIYDAAHQIGRLLGMQYDNEMSECSKGDYIMTHKKRDLHTPIWSKCSRQVAKELWRTKQCLLNTTIESSYTYEVYTVNRTIATAKVKAQYDNTIKREWTAKKQCELYLRNRNANVVTLLNVCQYLQCEEPTSVNYVLTTNNSNFMYNFNYTYFFAGPALEGTHCALHSECQDRECVFDYRLESLISGHSEEGTWSEWEEESCKSLCLEKSKGVVAKRRICRAENNRMANCNGSSYDVKMCDDSIFCNRMNTLAARLPLDKFIDINCEEYSKHLPQLNLKAKGIQEVHNFDKPWMACSIYCLQTQKKEFVISYYSPREEVTNTGLDPYLPDGTWCHTENGRHYFCQKRLCLPEN
nr:PREDICTED: A disintegrin and metalloproteinase with thrombospondin motifs 17-like [Linepithema humile]